MAGHSTREKAGERLLRFQPEKAGQEPVAAGGRERAGGLMRFGRAVKAGLPVFASAAPAAFGRESARGTGFLFLPVFAATGALVYFNAGSEPRLSPMLFALTFLAGCSMLARNRASTRLVLRFLIAFTAGMLCAKLETIRAGTPMLGSEVTTRMTGRISGMARDAKGGWRLTLDVIATQRPVLRFGPDRVVISTRKLPRNVRIGDGLNALVHLRPQSGPVRPGNYDFAFYNYYRGIGAAGFAVGMPEKVAVAPKPGIMAAVLLAIERLRQQLTHRILRNIKGEPGDIATSLVTGQRDGISDETNNAMRVSGLSHVLSISGFHMALVAAIIMGLMRAIFALFPDMAVRYPVKKLAAATALLASAFYLLLSGADIAAQRSFAMLAVMLLAVTVDRAAISMRNLAIAACITIVCAPHEILGPGFQMSYSATAALIAFYGFLARYRLKRGVRAGGGRGLRSFPARALGYIGGIALTSLVAGSVSSIFAAYHFSNTAPFGLIGNALALPVVSVLVMPFAVLGLLAMPFDLDWLPLAVMGWGIEVVILIAKTVTSHSPAGNPGSMPEISLILAAAALVLFLFLSTWLRVLALPLAAAAIVLAGRVSEPAIMISEDGKLVAIRTQDDGLAVNRHAASPFILKNWQQGYAAQQIVRPAAKGAPAGPVQFECPDGLCLAREPGGLIVAYTDDAARMADACAQGDIVILAFAGRTVNCQGADRLVLSKRELALEGATEIRLGKPPSAALERHALPNGPAPAQAALARRLASAAVRHAISASNRPWNGYRVYSRAARNLEERRPGRKTPGPDGKNEPLPGSRAPLP